MFKRIKVLVAAFLISAIAISIFTVRWDLLVKNWVLLKKEKDWILLKKEIINDQREIKSTEPMEPGEEKEAVITGDESGAVLKDSPADFKLFLPVPEHFLETSLFDPENPKGIIFSLPKETLVKAVFQGKVKDVLLEQKPFEDESQLDKIVIESDNGEFLATYLIKGDALVQQGDDVNQVTVLARTTEEDLNVYLQLHDKNGDVIKLSKEMFW